MSRYTNGEPSELFTLMKIKRWTERSAVNQQRNPTEGGVTMEIAYAGYRCAIGNDVTKRNELQWPCSM